MVNIKPFVFNPFQENTYLVWDSMTLETAIVDPGMSNKREEELLDRFITEEQLKVKAILLTHAHIDHTFGVDHLRERYKVPVLLHKSDESLGQQRMEQARKFHLPVEITPLVVDRFIDESEVLTLGDNKVMALHAPGHSPGSLLYYIPSANSLISGDVLFQGSIGRTDLPGGNYGQLIASINGKIVTLPPSTIVYPGHGPSTTIAREMRSNPYF